MRRSMFLILICAGYYGRTEPSAPHVLLITVDTLRPDGLGWVSGKHTTPALDELARSGYAFPAATSPVPITLPAHCSLMTGLNPHRHGVHNNGEVLGKGPTTLAEQLGQNGYQTAAFVSGYPLATRFGLDRGFDHYDEVSATGADTSLERNALDTTAAALAWLTRQKGPCFLWVHYYDPHEPYQAHQPQTPQVERGPFANYYEEIEYVDSAVALLRAGLLKQSNTAPLTIFTADHGESLGEHGESTHGYFVYQSTLSVPLVFHYPERIKASQSSQAPRLVDILPTVLGLLNLPVPPLLDGVNLLRLLKGEEFVLPPTLMESHRPWHSYGWSPLEAVRHGGWKLVIAPKPELYYLVEDPGERNNLVEQARPKVRELQAMYRAAQALPSHQSQQINDPEVSARLRALGYLGTTRRRGKPRQGLPDPKDRIREWNQLGAAEVLMSDDQFEQALDLYNRVLAADADNRLALSRSGSALVSLGRAEEGIDRLQGALRLDPEHSEIRTSLAAALSQAGHFQQAADQWMELLKRQPRYTHGWVQLANSLGLAGKPAKAVIALDEALRLDPNNPTLLLRQGFAAFAARDVSRAVVLLEQAADITGPDAFSHPGALGLLLQQTGRSEAAIPWLRRCRATESEYAQARFQLSLYEAAAGNLVAATAALHQAVSSDPRLLPRAKAHPLLSPLITYP